MADAVPGAGSFKRFGKLNKIPKLAKTIIIVVVLAVVAYLIWNHFHNANNSGNTAISISHLETISQGTANGYLNAKDYTNYQLDRQDMANQYLAGKDYSNAERVMNEVLANVPASKITERSYSVLYQIEKGKGNVALEKKYLGLMIASLKAEGNNTLATVAQKELDSLK